MHFVDLEYRRVTVSSHLTLNIYFYSGVAVNRKPLLIPTKYES